MKNFKADFIFAILVLSLILIAACLRKVEEPKEPEDDFLKVPEYETETHTPIYQTQVSNSTPTYWYVIFEEIKPGDEMNINWYRVIKLNTPYFDFVEARIAVPVEVTGEIYFNFIIQVNKESYESYYIFREL